MGAHFSGGRRALGLAIATLLLGACALQPPRVDTPRPQRQTIDHFSFDGNAAARQGDRAWRVGVSWDHRPDHDDVLVTGPLGQGLANIVREGRAARLTTADRKVYGSDDADALARDVLGLPLPVAELPRWLLGDVQATRSDAAGRPVTAVEGEWRLRYEEYESPAPDALPIRLRLERDDLELVLRIDQWNLE